LVAALREAGGNAATRVVLAGIIWSDIWFGHLNMARMPAECHVFMGLLAFVWGYVTACKRRQRSISTIRKQPPEKVSP
jgi:hypothetical protein